MTALVKGMTQGTQVPLSDDYEDGNTLIFKREGLVGFDIFNIGRSYTPWAEIDKIIVSKDKLKIQNRFPEDINTAYIDQETNELVIKNISPIEPTPENRKQYVVEYDLDPQEERCILFWRDQMATLVLYLRQSKFLGTLSDGVPVYALQIPKVEFECKLPQEREWRVRNDVNVPGEITVIERRGYGNFYELGNEVHKSPIIVNNKRLKVRYDGPRYKAEDA